jgi:hypothetical protein
VTDITGGFTVILAPLPSNTSLIDHIMHRSWRSESEAPRMLVLHDARGPIGEFRAEDIRIDDLEPHAASLTLRFPVRMYAARLDIRLAPWRTGGTRARRAVVRRVRT